MNGAIKGTKKLKDMAKFIDLTGKKIGMLNVLSLSDEKYKGGGLLYNVRCECGVEKKVSGAAMRSGRTLSCGNHREYKKNPDSPFLRTAHQYKTQAEGRGLTFNLTHEELKVLFQDDCHYCGSKPSNKKVLKSGDSYIYNGVDRKNNDIGYETGNVVSCCYICNRAKNSMPYQDFIDWIKNINIKTNIQ